MISDCRVCVLRDVGSNSDCVNVDKEFDSAEEKRTENGSLQSCQVCTSCNGQGSQVWVGPEGEQHQY